MNVLQIIDSKGRTGEPRKQFVPLTPLADEVVQSLAILGKYLSSTDGANPIGAKFLVGS